MDLIQKNMTVNVKNIACSSVSINNSAMWKVCDLFWIVQWQWQAYSIISKYLVISTFFSSQATDLIKV